MSSGTAFSRAADLLKEIPITRLVDLRSLINYEIKNRKRTLKEDMKRRK